MNVNWTYFLEEHVAGPISELLHPGELQGVTFKAQEISEDLAFPDRGHEALILELLIVGETFSLFLSEDSVEESATEMRARLRSELQTWISESAFGWGELRP
jgi:hypothetical protein